MKNILITAAVVLVIYLLFFRKKETAETNKPLGDLEYQMPDRHDWPVKPFEKKRIRPVPSPVLTNTIANGSAELAV